MILFNDDDDIELEKIDITGMTEEKPVVENEHINEVNNMMAELDEIERSLGMKTEFDDIVFPAPKPIKLTPRAVTKSPEEQVVHLKRSDIAKLDDDQLDAIMRRLNKIDGMEEEIQYLREVIDERLNLDFVAMYQNILEKNNIEAIKTYRNIQAVIVEENAKQNRALFGIDGKSDSLKRRLNNVIIFSIISFVVSILVMLMQILPALGFDLF